MIGVIEPRRIRRRTRSLRSRRQGESGGRVAHSSSQV